MKRFASRAGVLAGALLLAGCSDGPLPAPEDLAAFAEYDRYNSYEVVVDNGSYSSYQTETTFAMNEGEYVDLDGQDVHLQQTFNEQHTWQGDAYDATLAFPSPDRPFGPDYPVEHDVGQVYVNTEGEPFVHDRAGTPLVISSEEEAMFASLVKGPALASAGTGTETAAANRDRREPVDRLLVTPAGSARTLARLRENFAEAHGPGGVLRFSRNEGQATVQYTFDPRTGVVTGSTTSMPGGLEAQAVRNYVAAGRVRVLTEERTTIRDPQGRTLAQFAMRYRNLSIR
ncbi:MAG: hypothetical protein KY464_12625 [Gemmatimonadetes bacterium]|nr:hypothetical protein [Gemmatimonadota bacterium]